MGAIRDGSVFAGTSYLGVIKPFLPMLRPIEESGG